MPLKNNQTDTITFTKKAGILIVDLIQNFVIALAIYLLIFHFVFQPTQVIGASMDPTLHDGGRVITDVITYRFRNPRRGDVITFEYPLDPSQHFVKRIIALPDEDVVLKDGHFYIYNKENPDGFLIHETYLPEDLITETGPRISENMRVRIPHDSYFVLGDNRKNSSDSRIWGFVPKKNIFGRAIFCYWPIVKVGIVK